MYLSAIYRILKFNQREDEYGKNVEQKSLNRSNLIEGKAMHSYPPAGQAWCKRQEIFQRRFVKTMNFDWKISNRKKYSWLLASWRISNKETFEIIWNSSCYHRVSSWLRLMSWSQWWRGEDGNLGSQKASEGSRWSSWQSDPQSHIWECPKTPQTREAHLSEVFW